MLTLIIITFSCGLDRFGLLVLYADSFRFGLCLALGTLIDPGETATTLDGRFVLC